MQKDELTVLFPKNLNELLSLYSSNPDAAIFSGALELYSRNRLENTDNSEQPVKKIISISSVPELKKIHRTDKFIDIGAATTISQILRIGQYVIPPLLYAAISQIGPPSIRNIATIGGNILQLSTISNTLPALCALNAGFEIRSLTKSRWVPASQIITNTKTPILKKMEILVRIRIPLILWEAQVFKKVALESNIYPGELIFCGLANIIKNIINDLKIIIGRQNRSLLRYRSLETHFIGKKIPIQEKDIIQLRESLDKTLPRVDENNEKEYYLRNTTIRLFSNFFKELKQ